MSQSIIELKRGLRRYLEEKIPHHGFSDNECYSCNCDSFRQEEFRTLLKHSTDYLLAHGWTERHISYWFNNFSLNRLRYDSINKSIVPGSDPCFDLRAIYMMLEITGTVENYIPSDEKAA